MSRRSRLLLLCLLAAGCSPYKPFDSAAYVRQKGALAGVAVPFEINDEVRAAYDESARRVSGQRKKVAQVVDFIFDRLDLTYSLAPTHDAIGTFRERRGNCLSFVNLFVGLAREQGLAPFYVEVTDYQTWNQREGMVVSQGHIVAGMYLEGELATYDFLPYRPKAYKDFKPIDDLTATAHYYNNLAAEALMDGDLAAAGRNVQIATTVAPGFVKAINNLGVYQARSGHPEQALATYQRGLALEPDNPTLLTNLSRVYQRLGRDQEAADLFARLESTQNTNPFFFVYQGEMALSHGDTAKALEYMARALRQDTELPEIHLGLVKVYLAMGDLERARHHLERALKLDATNTEALRYARLLAAQ
ncbi:MAG TPA: tetratricopeptide repeat protein [Thermoanaerobaculia bacterium]|nr:tetratricopeptide repeat protein [Thermoanaerobaculia bacterium]